MKTYIQNRIPFYKLNSLIAALLFLSISCSTDDQSSMSENLPASEVDNGINYAVSEEQFNSSNMTLVKLETQDFHQIVKATGMFDVPPLNRVSVSVYFGGYVKELKLLPGEQVKEGQTIFVLENPEFVQVQQDYLEAKGQLAYLKSDYDRQKSLAKDSITSQKNFLKSESDYVVTQVRYESLRKKLALMSINPEQLLIGNIKTEIAIKAPINGFVTQINITKGAFLKPTDPAMTIVDTDHMHLELNIFEKDLNAVAVGQLISFKTQDGSNKKYDAEVHLINKTVNQDSRTIAIHGHLMNEEIANNFTPGMYLEAEIYTNTDSKLALPKDAVIEIDNHKYVLIRSNSGSKNYAFEKMEVKTGLVSEGNIEILNTSDFDKDDEFLSKGAFQLIQE